MGQQKLRKVLFVATLETHILSFHIPFIRYFQEKDYEVHVAVKLGARRNELEDNDIVCHNIDFDRNPYSAINIIALKQLIKVMKNNKFSLVHVHTPVGAFFGRLAAKITDTKPVLYTAHGFHFYRGASLRNWFIYYNMEKLAARWTDGLITINKEDYEAASKLPLRTKNRVFNVHGVGVDLNKYKTDDENKRRKAREKLGLKNEDICILTVGELIERKNHIQIIKSIEKLKKDNVFCYLVGQGKLEEELKKYVKTRGLDNNIKFLGFQKDIPELLAACDVFCLMSFQEGLPRCIMEAMAAGKPIIATDVRGNRDLIQDGKNGILVPVKDYEATARAIERLSEDKMLREKMGLESLRLIREYSIEKVLEEMHEIYNFYLTD